MIDKSSPLPLYYQLKEALLEQMQSMQPDTLLPSENQLIEQYGLSRTTVRQAISELLKDDRAYTVKGKGTFVSRPKIDLRYMNKVESFSQQITENGMQPSTKVLTREIVGASSVVAKALGIAKGAEVIHIERIRYADDEAIAYVDSYHPYPLCRALLEHDLSRESLYNTLAGTPDAKVVRVKRSIEAKLSDNAVSHLLNIKVGFPIQFFVSVAYAASDTPVEYCQSQYRGDRNIFTVDLLA